MNIEEIRANVIERGDMDRDSVKEIDLKVQIESDYRSMLYRHLATGDLESVITYDDYRNNYYKTRYKQYLQAAIESDDFEVISKIEDFDNWMITLFFEE